jgi:uncharacterized protein Usg
VSKFSGIRTTSFVRIRKLCLLDKILLDGKHYFSLKSLLFFGINSELEQSSRLYMLFANKQKSNRPIHLSVLKSYAFQDYHISVVARLIQKTAQFLLYGKIRVDGQSLETWEKGV